MEKKQNVNKIQIAIDKAEVYDVDPSFGLNQDQVVARKEKSLTNIRKKLVTKSYSQIIFDNVFSVLNIILFVVFGFMVSAKLPITSYVFMVILVANIVIGLIQDFNARRMVDRLRVVSETKAKVIREGKEIEIASDDIVLSDIVCLSLGNQIVADAVVVSGSVLVDEALLTGESVPVKKSVGDHVFSGTFITKGNCLCKVEKVGAANYAETLQKKASAFGRPKSEIKKSINGVIWICGFTSVVIGATMAVTWLLRHNITPGAAIDYTEFVSSFSGSMVALIPAGMVLLTSLTLAAGVIALSKKRMLVQQLYCIEMLARVDTLCLDKTGTLTDGTMNVAKLVVLGKKSEEEIKGLIAAICFHTKDCNATAFALQKEYGTETTIVAKYALPFDSATKYSGFTDENNNTAIIGAYGFVPAKENKDAENVINEYSAKGYRCIVLATSKKPIKDDRAPEGMEIEAVVVISDHVKEDAKDNVKWFQDNGVKVRVISGDNPITVSEIAKQVGVIDADKFISLEGKNLDEVAEIANDYVVFGRVTPEQKAALVKAYKKAGSTVAMTGDGVNDILALKAADCSIAMANGADAAKNVAHLVALDNDFSKLPDVVAQGRRVINNLQRTCSLFLNKTVFAFIVSTIFLVSSWINPNAVYPYSTQSLLVWEILSIGLAAFFLALQPSNEKLKGSFTKNILIRSIPGGIMATVAGLIPFFIYNAGHANWYCFSGGYDQMITMSVLCFTIISFGILCKVSWPLDRYRLLVFVSMLVLGIVLLGCDFLLVNKDPSSKTYGRGAFFGLNWSELKIGFLYCVLAITVGCIVVYFVFDHLIKKWFLRGKGYEN